MGGVRRSEPPGSAALLAAWEKIDRDGNGMLSAHEAAGLRKMLKIDWDIQEAWEEAVRLFESKSPVAPDATKENPQAGGSGAPGDLEISFASFVQLYNLHMGAQRRKCRMDVKNLFDKLDADHTGTINKQQLKTLVKRAHKKLALLPPKFDLDRDWGYLTSERESTEPNDPFLVVSWPEFERWWKNRCGLTEANTPMIPEFFIRQLNDPSHTKSSPKLGEHATVGSGLWKLLAPKLRSVAMMTMAWESDGNWNQTAMHTGSIYSHTPIPPGIRDPDSTFSVAWDLIQVIFLVYVSITVPYRVSFGAEVLLFSFTWFWDTMIDLYFITDMVLNFRTAYTDANGVREVKPRKIAANYCKGWFALDFVSCIPVGHITTIIAHAKQTTGNSAEAGSDNMRVLKSIRLLRMSKMLRLARIKRIMQKYESLMIVQEYMGIGFTIATIVLMAHFLSCLWYVVGLENQVVTAGLQGRELGRADLWAGPRSTTVLSWVNEQPWFEQNSTEFTVTTSTRYITSMYYVLNALDGYGQTDSEKLMGVVALIFTIVIKGSVAGIMSSMLITLGGSDQEVNDQLRAVKAWLLQTRVPTRMMKMTLEFFGHIFRSRVQTSDAEALAYMPPGMVQEFRKHIYTRFLEAVPVFRNLPAEVMTALRKEMKPMVAMKKQCIIEEGSRGSELCTQHSALFCLYLAQ